MSKSAELSFAPIGRTVFFRSQWRTFLPVVGVLIAFPLGPDAVLAVVLVVLLAFALNRLSASNEKSIRSVLVAAFLLRVFVAAIDQYAELFPYAWDDYFTLARVILRNIEQGYRPFVGTLASPHVKSYSFFSALVYAVLGQLQLYIRILNAFFAVFALFRVYQVARRLGARDEYAKTAIVLLAFLPSRIVFSGLDMRDSLLFFLTADVFHWLTAKRTPGLRLIVVALEVALVGFLRRQNLPIYGVSLLVAWMLFLWLNRRKRAFVVTVLGIGLVLFVFRGLLHQWSEAILTYINVEMRFRTSGGSAYLAGMFYRNWLDVLLFAPIRVVHFMFGPFPWVAHGVFMLVASAESILLLSWIVSTFPRSPNFRVFRESRGALFLVVFLLVAVVAVASVDSNYGTAIRHRMPYVALLLGCLTVLRSGSEPGVERRAATSVQVHPAGTV